MATEVACARSQHTRFGVVARRIPARMGYGPRGPAQRIRERIRDNCQSAPAWRPSSSARPGSGATPAHPLGACVGLDHGCTGVRPLHRAPHLRGGSRRLPSPGRQVHLHFPPLFLRLAEHEPPVHVPTVCRTALRPLAADIQHRGIGADGLDHCATCLCSPGYSSFLYDW